MDFYGTLGTACGDRETIRALFCAGMTGARLNLSHVTLSACEPWLEDFWSASAGLGIRPRLVIDLQGPELRVGRLDKPISLTEGTEVPLGEGGVPVPEAALDAAEAGDRVALDDSAFLLEVERREGRTLRCRVLRGGTLQSRKSLALLGKQPDAPALTGEDRENLARAGDYGVTHILQPFVRGREDVEAVRSALEEKGLSHIKIMAKIENRQGMKKLDEIIAAADEICVARGDLGNGMPLWELPGAQKEIARRCRRVRRPFCVATQLLWSMQERSVPTRAEVCDIYNAVLDGAAGLMLTGETAVGRYPAEAMTYLVRTALAAAGDC